MSHFHDAYIVLSKKNNEIISVFDDINLLLEKYNNNDYIIKGPFVVNEIKTVNNFNSDHRKLSISSNSNKYLPNRCPDAPTNKKKNINYT